MNQTAILDVGGIKCDTKGCSYRDDTVKVSDYKNWLDKPCPKCGGNLLTKADYKFVVWSFRIVKVINVIFWPFTLFKRFNKKQKISLEFDGSGNPKIKK